MSIETRRQIRAAAAALSPPGAAVARGRQPGTAGRGRRAIDGTGVRIRFAVGRCPLGNVLMARTARGVCAILMGDGPDALARDLRDRFPRAVLVGDDARARRWLSRLAAFVAAPGLGLDLPLDLHGTAFQMRVWDALRAIPAGQTASYTGIADRIGAPRAARAVASACAANALAVAIPCHRVVRSDATSSGYRWGIARKLALLALEAQA